MKNDSFHDGFIKIITRFSTRVILVLTSLDH